MVWSFSARLDLSLEHVFPLSKHFDYGTDLTWIELCISFFSYMLHIDSLTMLFHAWKPTCIFVDLNFPFVQLLSASCPQPMEFLWTPALHLSLLESFRTFQQLWDICSPARERRNQCLVSWHSDSMNILTMVFEITHSAIFNHSSQV